MNQNCFKFNNAYYQQLIDSTAVGNCPSPFIANPFMSKLEEGLKNNLRYILDYV